MEAVELLAGRGGWPLTMFLTPDGKPFYGGTYFPPEDRHGLPGFPRLLMSVVNAYQNQQPDVQHNVERLTRALGSLSDYTPANGELKPNFALSGPRSLSAPSAILPPRLRAAPPFPLT